MSKEELENALPKAKDEVSNNDTVEPKKESEEKIEIPKTDDLNNSNETVNNTNNTNNNNLVNKFNDIMKDKNEIWKKWSKQIIIGGAVVVLLIVLLIVKTVSSSPKNVYKSLINSSYKEIHSYLKEADDFYKKHDLLKESIKMNANVKLDSSLEELKDLTDYTYSLNMGIDLDKEIANTKIGLKGDKATIDGTITYADKKAYLTSTLFDEIIDITEEADIDTKDFEEFKKALDENDVEFNADDYDYVIKSFKDALIKGLDNKYMKKSKGSFEVDGKTVKATKITYTLDEDSLKDLVVTMSEELLENDKFLKKVAQIGNFEKSDVKDFIKDLKAEAKDIEIDEDVEINIFIKGLFNKVVGFNIAIDDDEYVSFYKDNKNCEFIVDPQTDAKLVVTATEHKKETEVIVKYNKEKLGTITIRELSDDTIDLDYTINMNENKINGTIYLTQKVKKDVYSGEFKVSVKLDKDDFKVSGDYSYEFGGDIDTINTKKAVKPEDLDFNEIKSSIEKAVKDDKKLKDLLDEAIDEIEKESLDLNYYGMVDITSDKEAIELLSKQKATVLYVGGTYYFDDNQDSVFTTLRDLQKSLDFYSYLYRTETMSEEFKAALKDVKYSCELNNQENNTTPELPDNNGEVVAENENTTENIEAPLPIEAPQTQDVVCNELPVIYLIKDGKVQEALRGPVTEEQLKNSLKNIGIE